MTIERDAQSLSAGGGGLFDFEKARLSERIREATDALVSLRGNIRDYSVTQMAEVDAGLKLLDGDVEAPDGDRDILFARWIMAVLDSEDGPKEARIQASSVASTGTNTRMSRMAASGRVLEADSRDVTVLVISENDFAVELHGVDNAPVVGVKVTVKDLNGNTVVTKPTEDPKAGTATLTLENVKAEWNGRRTRCVITDAAGTTVVSDEAVLSVIGTDKQPETGSHTRLPLYLAVALIAAALLLILRRRERGRT